MSFLRHVLSRLRKNKVLPIQLSIICLLLTVIYFLYYIPSLSHRANLPKWFHSKISHSVDPEHLKQFRELNPVVEGWGEGGAAVLLNDDEKKLASLEFSKAAFQVWISDRISPNRSLPDVRPEECAAVKYNLNSLGQASIVIIYTNEIWSALIRTIWSVINRSPPELLKEIILVDDFSSDPSLKTPLDQYIADYFSELVRVIRLEERKGLIKARLVGKKAPMTCASNTSHCQWNVT